MGHVVELGVGRGRNAVIFSRFFQLHNQQRFRHYYGFDTFDGYPDTVLKDNIDFEESSHSDTSLDFVREISNLNKIGNEVTYIKGDISKTLPKFLKSETPKFREGKLKISIIYVDCNDYKTAIESLECCMPYLSNGGVIAIDECRLGGETKALTEICSKYNLELFTSTFGGFVSLYTVKNT